MIRKALIIAGGLGNVTRNGFDGVPKPLLEVAGLSLIKRCLLSAKKAGIYQFLVLIDRKGKQIKRRLEEDEQLKDLRLEWAYSEGGGLTIAQLLRVEGGAADGGLLVITANGIFHPQVLKSLQEVLPVDGKVIRCVYGDNQGNPAADTGIYFYPAQALLDLEGDPVLGSPKLMDAHKTLAERRKVEYMEVADHQWQRIETADDLRAAEKKIERWLYKPTDGVFAGLNRRVSIPISRRLIKTPITPNQVTIFTLFLSLISGLCFALGGYLYTLVGAVLSQIGSILDGCDGEVARFKFMESEFGCWLETVCDYVYYVAVYTGMCVGFYRETSRLIYPLTGVLILFGALMSFITVSYQRRKFTDKGKPEEYGTKIIQKLEASHRRNLFYYLAARLNGLAKRAALPYFILLFAILGDERFIFFMSALGANMFWTLTLYSNQLFREET